MGDGDGSFEQDKQTNIGCIEGYVENIGDNIYTSSQVEELRDYLATVVWPSSSGTAVL